MSVRQSLLAILAQGPCYGYQLRAEFDRRTGSVRPLNVGQVYNTLDRLERDGLARTAGDDDKGHVFYEITEAGQAAAESWLTSPTTSVNPADETAVRLALAVTLPGSDVAAAIRRQREATAAELDRIDEARRLASEPADAADVATAILLESSAARAEAEIAWLERTEDLLRRAEPVVGDGIPLDTSAAKRGRPAKTPLAE